MIYLHGFGHFHPENQLDNAFLESLDIGTNDKWIVDRVGIKNRRTVLPLDYIRATKNQDLRGGSGGGPLLERADGRRARRGWRSSAQVFRRAISAWWSRGSNTKTRRST